MKKILSVLAIMAVAFSLTGCTGPDDTAGGRMGSVEGVSESSEES